ncbi:MAG: carboxypeptidase-like regulatory domain-containing protein [Ferruginibacter sp.]
MKKIIFTWLIFTLFGVGVAIGQTKDISGTVTNEKNENIIGATIKVKGTTLSASSDDNGVFNLKGAPDTAVIVISAPGYQDQEVSIADKTNFTIVLVKATAKDHALMLYPYDDKQVFLLRTGKENCSYIM